MKKIILYLIVVLNVTTILSQTKNDILNLNNPNLELLDSLLFKEAMIQRKLNNKRVIEKDYICGLAAKYQSEYMSYYNSFSHENTNEFKGVLLKEHYERFEFFKKKTNSKVKYRTFHEILTMMNGLGTTEYIGLVSKTYENYAQVLIGYFMTSKSHKSALLYDVDSGKMVCNFKTHYNQKTKSLYVTGFYSFVGK